VQTNELKPSITAASGKSTVRKMLLGEAVILLGVVALVSSAVMAGPGGLVRPDLRRDYGFLTAGDAVPGKKLVMPSNFPMPGGGVTALLLFMGDCASCQLKNLDLTKLVCDSRYKVVLVHRGGVFTSADLAKKRGWSTYEDIDGTLELQLNGSFVPRAYLVDSDSLLMWNQPEMGIWPKGVRYGD